MRAIPVALSLVALTAACGTAGGPGDPALFGEDDAGTGNVPFTVGDAAGAQGLDAYIFEQGQVGQVGVKVFALSCSGACATVQAVGTGGHPPYAYAWEDGSTNPVRRVCPTADTGYSVKVTDSGEAGENPMPPQTAK